MEVRLQEHQIHYPHSLYGETAGHHLGIAWPEAYGFYSNVNPQKDHPNHSQREEIRLGVGFLGQRRATLLFNGYAEQVADLYRGMDLRKFY